jgi:hypothetical protein
MGAALASSSMGVALPWSGQLWDEVWADYDRRRSVAMVVPAAARPMSQRQAVRRGVRGRAVAGLVGLLLSLSCATGYAAAPFQAVQALLAAVQRQSLSELAAQVDWAAVQADQARQLALLAAVPAAGLDGAEGFLQGMARDVAGGLGRPEALLAALRARLGAAEGGGWQVVSILPEGLARLRVTLAGAAAETGLDGPATAPEVALTLALRDPWRLDWQVVAVDLAE